MQAGRQAGRQAVIDGYGDITNKKRRRNHSITEYVHVVILLLTTLVKPSVELRADHHVDAAQGKAAVPIRYEGGREGGRDGNDG